MAEATADPVLKRCSRCKKRQDRSAFGIDRKRKDGLNVWCRTCKSWGRHREYLRAKHEKRCGVQLQLDLNVKVCPRCKTLKTSAGFGTDSTRKHGLAPYCRDCTRTQMAELYVRDTEKWNARSNKWRRENPRKVSELAMRRIARQRNATVVPITKEQVIAKWEYWGGKCWICGSEATATDHVKPLSKGGAHMVCNFRPICKPCNSRKNSRWPFDLDELRQRALTP